jgi:hypothetical protein
VVVCYIAHKGGVCVCEASRLEQPVHSAVAETRLNFAVFIFAFRLFYSSV